MMKCYRIIEKGNKKVNKQRKSLIMNIIVGCIALAILLGSASVYRHLKKRHEQEWANLQTSQQNKPAAHATDIPRLKTVIDEHTPVYPQIDRYLERENFNGSIAIYDNGHLKMNKGYGFQDIESGKTNDANTLFLIGSAQKFFTGIILKKLEIEGKVNINAPVTQYLPQFKTKKPITLKDLMLHQSGLYKYKGSKNRLNLDEAVAAIQKKGINRKYYHKHFYNDANYLVLAKVIEKVTHQSYTENYYKHFGSPLNLKHSAFFNDVRYQEDMAKGYKRNKNVPVFTPTLFLDQYYGAGNLYMSTHDMGLVVRNLQMNRMFPENVTQPYIHEINTARYPENYRYGFYAFPGYNRINGVFFGQTFTTYFNDRYIVVIATNYENNKPNLLENKMKHIYFNMLKQPKTR